MKQTFDIIFKPDMIKAAAMKTELKKTPVRNGSL
jgi:hypothetical protein